MATPSQPAVKAAPTTPAKSGSIASGAPKAPPSVAAPRPAESASIKPTNSAAASRAALESAQVLHKPTTLLTEADLTSFKSQIVDSCNVGGSFSDLLAVLAKVPAQLQSSFSLQTTFNAGYFSNLPLSLGAHVERSLPTMQRTGRTLQASHVDATSVRLR